MPLVKPSAPPGVLAQATQAQARGNWFDVNLVRWRTGYLEKIGGWRRLIEEAFATVIRRMHAWLDLDNRKNLLVGTDGGVFLLIQNTLHSLGHGVNLQAGYFVPAGAGAAATKFSVTGGSKEVTVKTVVPVSVGDTFFVRIPISIGGRQIAAGTFYTVKSLVAGVGYTFDMSLPALASEVDTYGIPLLNNNLINAFTVTWKEHGLGVGSSVRLTQATSIRLGAPGVWEKLNFFAPAGTVANVDTVIDADHFTFKMGGFGTGDGAGTSAYQVYVGSHIQNPTGGTPTVSLGSVLAVSTVPGAGQLGDPQRNTWFLGNLGQDGLVLATNGPLEVYRPPDGIMLSPVTTAPRMSNGMLVAMPQAQVILWGTEAIIGSGPLDPLLIRWSDAGTYDDYVATVRNQAGSYRLSRGSRIVGAIQAPQATLILTDTDLWQMSYIGPPLIYGFTIVGSGCGLVAPHAIGNLGRSTFWQGQKNIWKYGDTAVQPVPCTVWDYIFEDLDPVNINKCHAAPNSTTNEIAFYFPSKKSRAPATEDNLLWFSQKFDNSFRWSLLNAAIGRFVLFETLYVYEELEVNLGWLDAAGIPPISWFDDDLQGEIVSNPVFAPDGTDTAMSLSELAINGMHLLSQLVDKPSERITYTLSIYAHEQSTKNLTLRAGTIFGEAFATFDPTFGNLLAAGVTYPGFTLLNAEMITDTLGTGQPGNGWRRYVMTFVSDDSPTLDIFFNITNGTDLSYMGTPPDNVIIWGAQLVLGDEPLDYEMTTGIKLQNETRRYVKLNTAEGMAWDKGQLSRSAWLDESIWGTPLGADTTPERVTPPPPPEMGITPPVPELKNRNLIQQHEIGYDDDLEPMRGVFAESGFTELGDGTMLMLIDQCHPDMKWLGRSGGVKVSLRATNYPQGIQHLFGPYSVTAGTQWFNPRVRTRYVAVRYDWEPRTGFSARVGVTTFHVKTAGRLP